MDSCFRKNDSGGIGWGGVGEERCGGRIALGRLEFEGEKQGEEECCSLASVD